MAAILFDIPLFRATLSAFADQNVYSDLMLQSQWDFASTFITADQAGGWYAGFVPAQQRQALNLMTAHLVALNDAIAAGDPTGLVQSASIDKVSVTLTPPPEVSQWQWWLNQTPYGQQLLALLQIITAGGRFVSRGAPVVSAFRRGAWR